MRFSLGVNYWPREAAMAMWRAFDAGAIAEDFARIVALGLDTVRFFLRWDDFQPDPAGVDPLMLERLERVVELAGAAGLRAIPTLASGHLNGVDWLPAWARDPATGRARSLYAGALLQAQLVFARAAGERLRAHPAIRVWDIGHAFSSLSRPSRVRLSSGDHSAEPEDERALAAWSRRITETLAEASAIGTTAGAIAADLTADRSVRLGTLCAPFAFASIQGSSLDCPFGRSRLDPECVPFLAMLAAGFSYKPVMVTGLGNPTCPPDRFSAFESFADAARPELAIASDDSAFATYPCLTEAENAASCTAVLERLHADGRLGALWWCWSDPAPGLRAQPPFAGAPQTATYGILRADGSEKPVAAALAAFAAEQREVLPARDMPMIAAAYYYRTLPVSTSTLFDAYLGFVSERRAASTSAG
jgi:hypothetical protein